MLAHLLYGAVEQLGEQCWAHLLYGAVEQLGEQCWAHLVYGAVETKLISSSVFCK